MAGSFLARQTGFGEDFRGIGEQVHRLGMSAFGIDQNTQREEGAGIIRLRAGIQAAFRAINFYNIEVSLPGKRRAPREPVPVGDALQAVGAFKTHAGIAVQKRGFIPGGPGALSVGQFAENLRLPPQRPGSPGFVGNLAESIGRGLIARHGLFHFVRHCRF